MFKALHLFFAKNYTPENNVRTSLSQAIQKTSLESANVLNISDNDMLSIYINGLVGDIKTHLILNQPETLAKAENLARLREAVMSNDSLTNARTSISQDHRIKELEGQVDSLVSLATKSKPNPNFQASNVNAISPNHALEQGVAIGGQRPLTKANWLISKVIC